MNYQHLLNQVQDHVLAFYKDQDTPNLVYHNQKHTEAVVAAATKIANHYQLNDHDFFVVVAAAWFHDLGYIKDMKDHEEGSAGIAEAFLSNNEVPDADIQLIKGCILATKVPQLPNGLLEQIICDADLFHLGTDDFSEKNKQLLIEYNLLHQTAISKAEWRIKTVAFIEQQHYFTDYCQLLLNDTKEKNIEQLKKKIAKDAGKTDEMPNNMANDIGQIAALAEGKPKGSKKGKGDRPDKGIESMFRISSSNHQRLSDMADKKAHIMITVNSIILSAIISLVLRRLNEYGYLIIPSFILLTISVLAMTFSILSTRPSIPKGTFTKADVDEKRVNLLFFGNFYKMKLEDYSYGMLKVMEDRDFLYGSLIKDIYAQGVVLGKKYHLLRIAYNIFMFGLILAVIAFIIASAFFSHHPAI